MKRLSKNRLALIASLDLKGITYDKVVDIWTKYETGLNMSISRHGKQVTLSKYKAGYVFLRNRILKLHNTPLPFSKVDKRGIPKILWALRPLLKDDRNKQRLALCICRSYEQITLPIDLNTKDITTPMEPEKVPGYINISTVFEEFLDAFTHKNPWYLGSLRAPIQPWSKVRTSLSKGPNGPAVATSHLDAKAILSNPPLWDSITELNIALGQEWITEWMVKQGEKVPYSNSYLTGKLSFSAEPAGKTRKFAMGDYWSQLSLSIIQDSLYDTLKSIPTDATANQDKGFKTLVEESNGADTYCFDLSSASDRIPAEMQKVRLRLMGGKKLADSWFRTMTDRDFFIKQNNTSVRWAIGQPLGLLSSFPAFALWHHDIIQLAANWTNFTNGKPLVFFRKYRLLGDDVVIFDKEVALRYQWLLDQVGLNINLDKSVIGVLGNSQIEFAKRLALNGKEYSSIRHNLLSRSDVQSTLDLVEMLRIREYTIPDTGHIGLLRILKSQDLLRFRFMLWLRNSESALFQVKPEAGDDSLSFKREDILKKVISIRTRHIIEKAMKVIPLDMETMFPKLQREIKSLGVPWCETTLNDRSIGSLAGSHPIVLALTQTSRELQFLMFDVLDDLEPDKVSPVEYLPVVNEKGYFHNRTDLYRYLSTVLVECLDEALQESRTKSDVCPIDSNKL